MHCRQAAQARHGTPAAGERFPTAGTGHTCTALRSLYWHKQTSRRTLCKHVGASRLKGVYCQCSLKRAMRQNHWPRGTEAVLTFAAHYAGQVSSGRNHPVTGLGLLETGGSAPHSLSCCLPCWSLFMRYFNARSQAPTCIAAVPRSAHTHVEKQFRCLPKRFTMLGCSYYNSTE